MEDFRIKLSDCNDLVKEMKMKIDKMTMKIKSLEKETKKQKFEINRLQSQDVEHLKQGGDVLEYAQMRAKLQRCMDKMQDYDSLKKKNEQLKLQVLKKNRRVMELRAENEAYRASNLARRGPPNPPPRPAPPETRNKNKGVALLLNRLL